MNPTQDVKNAPGALPSTTNDAPGVDRKINSATYFAHGHLLERQGAYEKAIENYKKALELQPDMVMAANRMGVTYNKMARHAEATRQFQNAIALKPDAAYPHNNLGFSFYLEGRFDEAERAYAKALELKPDFVRAKMNHALALGKLGRFDAAYQEFTAICSQSDALFNMGILLTEASRYVDAAQYLEAALAANPDNTAARAQLNEVARLAAMEARQTSDAVRVANNTATPATATLSAFATPVGAETSDPSVATLAATDVPTQPPVQDNTPPAVQPTSATPPAAEPTVPPQPAPEAAAASVPQAVPATPVADAPKPATENPATNGGVLELPAVDVPAKP
jgi:Tfp pilus assembly protein PilF